MKDCGLWSFCPGNRGAWSGVAWGRQGAFPGGYGIVPSILGFTVTDKMFSPVEVGIIFSDRELFLLKGDTSWKPFTQF